ncbi:hypothetical protein MLOOGBEN_25640 [Bacillus sp. EB106-08-02-XG196]|jgi:hypothetical protein|uniref:hypothetical protein n=1 Tax=Bacillus sp. EB106-08-02-XG196 TaxID=2737049 RepID=UPI0015C48BBA|nr:hypothetical protein [Bacillus sp. EB106-08-02-XG196]NWQ44072.1 hypothetical protein [Bacillus sp. EB106-08-02-XG196]
MKRMFISLGMVLVLSIPPIRHGLEESMIGQMLIQIPLLALAGYILGIGLKKRMSLLLSRYNHYGIPGLLIVFFANIYWILPRSIDAALNSALFETIKFITIPLLIGFPLALSWRSLHLTVKGFVCANVISMSFVMGWFYANSPIRLCNNYLTEQQFQLGNSFMLISAFLLISFFCKFFFIGIKNS